MELLHKCNVDLEPLKCRPFYNLITHTTSPGWPMPTGTGAYYTLRKKKGKLLSILGANMYILGANMSISW